MTPQESLPGIQEADGRAFREKSWERKGSLRGPRKERLDKTNVTAVRSKRVPRRGAIGKKSSFNLRKKALRKEEGVSKRKKFPRLSYVEEGSLQQMLREKGSEYRKKKEQGEQKKRFDQKKTGQKKKVYWKREEPMKNRRNA